MNSGNRTGRLDDAADWVSRMDGETWTAADEERLQHWLREDSANAGALLQAEAAWLSLDRMPAADQPVARRPEGIRHLLHRRRLLAVGAASLAASVTGVFSLMPDGTTLQTGRGEMMRTPLADGSVATINTDTEVVVRWEPARRMITLSRGEAWFQVVKDHARPFVVQAGDATVVAVGTAFSVRRGADGIDVLVTEGVVRVSTSSTDGEDVFLTAGQRARLEKAVLQRIPSTSASVDQVLAWRDGKIDLSGERLKDAIAQFNRYNRRQIVLFDPTIQDERLDGIFRTDDVDGFAKAVHNALGVPVGMTDDAVIAIGTEPTV